MDHKQPQKSTDTPKQVSDTDLEKVTGGNDVPVPVIKEPEKICRFVKTPYSCW